MIQEPPSSTFRAFGVALLLSTVVNASGIFTLTELGASYSRSTPKPKSPEILFDLNPLPHRQTYVDTPAESQPSEKDSDHISDKDSRVDSSKKGEETGLLPESDYKDLLPQAQRKGPLSPDGGKEFQKEQMQQALIVVESEKTKAAKKTVPNDAQLALSRQKTEQEDKIQKGMEGGETEVNEGKKIFENELVPTPQDDPSEYILLATTPSRAAEDLFPLPIISIGDHTKSENGRDSFSATGTGYGKYIKSMRDKMGLNFYKMVFFHYRTNYIFGSQAKAVFFIEPAGTITGLKVTLVKGDPLFVDYVETVIRNSEPFAPLHKGLAPYLEEGALRIDFLFGYDTKKEDKEKE